MGKISGELPTPPSTETKQEIAPPRREFPQSELDDSVRKVGQEIREYYLSRRDLLLEYAALAIEADGRTGFSDELAHVYTYLVRQIDYNRSYLFLDLFSGELRTAAEGRDSWLASDKDIFYTAITRGMFIVEDEIANLKEKAKEKHWGRDELTQEYGEDRRKELRQNLKERIKYRQEQENQKETR